MTLAHGEALAHTPVRPNLTGFAVAPGGISIALRTGMRVELNLYEHASLREYRELREFVRFCIERIEQDAGRAASWKVNIAPNRVCFACEITVHHDGRVVRAEGNGFDGAVAGRDAFAKIEKLLARREEAVRAVR